MVQKRSSHFEVIFFQRLLSKMTCQQKPQRIPRFSGGELDEKDRAPTNLVSNGAFHRASPALGKAAEAVLQEVEALKGGVAEPLKE